MNQKKRLSDRETEQLLDQLEGKKEQNRRLSDSHEDARILLAAGEILTDGIDTEKAWESFKEKQNTIRRKKTLFYLIGSIAASVVLCLTLGIISTEKTDGPSLISLYERTSQNPYIRIECNNRILHMGTEDSIINFYAQPCHHQLAVTTPAGREVKIILPDSSTVRLNSNSRLLYTQTAAYRKATLEGEAFFDITHDAVHPFMIQSGEVVSQVLGTSFNIKNYQGELPHIALLRGSLKVSAPQQEKIIEPGDEAMITANGNISIKKVSTTDMAAWTKGEFIFDQLPVAEVVRELGRSYNLNVKTPNKELPQLYIHFRCSRQTDIQTIVSMLNDVSGLHIQKQGNTLIIH